MRFAALSRRASGIDVGDFIRGESAAVEGYLVQAAVEFMIPKSLPGGPEEKRQTPVVLREAHIGLPLQLPIDVNLRKVRTTHGRHMIPKPRSHDRGRTRLSRLPWRRGNDKAKVVASSDARFVKVKALKVAAPGILFEYNVLLARRTASYAQRVQRTETYPCFNRKIGRMKHRRILDLHIRICSIETKSRTDHSRSAGRRASLQSTIVRAHDVVRIPIPGPPTDNPRWGRKASPRRNTHSHKEGHEREQRHDVARRER